MVKSDIFCEILYIFLFMCEECDHQQMWDQTCSRLIGRACPMSYTVVSGVGQIYSPITNYVLWTIANMHLL